MNLKSVENLKTSNLKFKLGTPPPLPSMVDVSIWELSHLDSAYPLVITNEENPKLVALLGQPNPAKNLVRFTREYPAPFGVLLYPFIISLNDNNASFMYIEDGRFLNFNGDKNLFEENGTPSDFMQDILKKSSEHASALIYTNRLLKEIKNLNILTSKTIEISGISYGDFLVVNRQALNNLDEKTMSYLAKGGHLELIFSHLKSLKNIKDFKQMLKM